MKKVNEVVPFNYNEIYEEIRKDFEEKGYDTSPGSNTSQLSNVMAYTVAMLNANTAININETILQSANLRKNIISVARNFGYEIQHKTSYVYNLTIEMQKGDFVIPKYTPFNIQGKTYYYLGKQIDLHNTEVSKIEVQVKEGILHSYINEPESLYITTGEIYDNGIKVPQYYIDIPYIDIEENGIEVYCSYFDDYGVFFEKEQWTKAQDTYIEIDEKMEKQFIRIDNIEYGTPRIYFRFAGIGNGIKIGTEVFLNVLETSGKRGNIKDINNLENIQVNLSNCKVVKIELVSEGTDEEDDKSIKENAPKLYNSANRLVIANDYIAACNRDNRVRNCIVWGGEDEFPKAPGHIWFTFLPNVERGFSNNDGNTYFNRNNSELNWDYTKEDDEQYKESEKYFNSNYIKSSVIRSKEKDKNGNAINAGVWDYLDTLKIPTLVYHNRHPIYCEFLYKVEIIKYFITENKKMTHKNIFDLINNFFDGKDSIYMENFDTEYFNSSLIKRIDKLITDVSGVNLYTKTRLVLNDKTVVLENPEVEYRDIYIPLALPYEKYFDDDGYLIIDRLPKIDTKGFFSYNEVIGDLYVDWSDIEKDIEDKRVKQRNHKLIIAPVRARYKCTYDFNKHQGSKKAILKFFLYPDSIQQIESIDFTFKNTKVYLIKDDVKSELEFNTDQGWFYNKEKPSEITFGALVDYENAIIEVETTPLCGFYYLFNSYTKDILIHLFVDGSVSGYEASLAGDLAGKYPQGDYYERYLYSYDDMYLYSNNDYYLYTEAKLNENVHYVDTIYTTPRSYLTTNDEMYLFTTDHYYLTTNGYALTDEDDENSYTGPIIKEINKYMYLRSGIKLDLFRRNRYLNLDYSSPNFRVERNVIPYLKSVEFLNIVD